MHPIPSRWSPLALALALIIAAVSQATAQPASTNAPARTNDLPASSTNLLARIRDEGLNRSQITNALIQLTEVNGPRLTGSPNFKRSAEWARHQLEKWGLSNSHLESWGPFGRGWSLRRFSAQMVEPQNFPLTGFPPAWSPGLSEPITADVVYVDATTEAELEAYRGRLKGVIALVSSPRELRSRTEPDAYRLTDANLLQLANLGGGSAPFFATGPGPRPDGPPSATNQIPRRDDVAGGRDATETRGTNRPSSTNTPASTRTNAPASRNNAIDRCAFAHREGAAAVITTSRRGDGNTLVVERASLPGAANRGTNVSNRSRSGLRVPWATNALASPPQVQVQAQDYNRMVRMIRQGQKLRMHLELDVEFHDEDLMGYNVIAEIPGGDLREEVVMLGGHLDSWHSGTGATDNAAGVAVAMEAVRILQAVEARPRRTVRIALWGGEEQGLLGSTAHVRRHFGYYTNLTNSAGSNVARSPRDARDSRSTGSSTNRSSRTTRKLIQQPEYENFSAYFNLDNGTGRIRGVYLQGNEAVRPLFRKWLEPFRDLGAETLTTGGTGATDHTAFDDVGLPGFQFIQDPLDYWSRTHHSNLDVYDRLQIDELKQAATIMAAFVYQTAMLDEKLPRKALRPSGREGR